MILTEAEREAFDVLVGFFWKFCPDPDAYEDELEGYESLVQKLRQ